MAIKPFNSIQGFSVGEIPANIILANGDITTTNITANGISNLGPVSNLILTGGSIGQVVTTDGSGNLTFTTISTSSNLAAPMPYFIPTGESYTVSNNFQGLFSEPIEIDGVFEILGTLVELGEPNESANTQVLFNNAGVVTGNTGFTFNKNNGNINITGNVIAGNTVSANFLIGDGGLLSNITAISNLAVSQIQNGSSLISFTGTNGNAVIEIGGVPNILVASIGGITTTGVVVSGVSNLGDVANVKITGGSAGYTLTTDGTGNLSWDAGSAGAESNISNGTSNVNIGTVNGAVTVGVGGTANIAVFSLSGLDMLGNVTASRLISNVTTGVAPLVVTSTTQVANLNSATAGTVRTNAQPNITSVGTLTGLSIAGDLAVTGNLTAGNISGTIATAGTVTNAAQPNITSVGTLSNLTVSGNITAFDVTASNNISGLSLTGTLATGVQTNITQVGTLSVLAVTANITAGNINAGNLLGANYIAGTLINGTQPNITQIGTLANLTVNGNADVGALNSGPIYANGTVNAGTFASNVATGSSPLTVVSTTKVANLYVEGADTAIAVTSSSQPNITSVGSLTNLLVSGSAYISGDLYVDGNITYLNVSSLAVEDPLISVGNGPNNAPLTTNDGKDRGLLLNYYDTNAKVAFMGWDNGNSEFAFGGVVSISSEVVTYNQLGNIRAGNAIFSNNVTANYFVGNLYGTANLATYATTANAVAGANVSGIVSQSNTANTAGTVTNNSQSNITSVGTLTQLSVTGNISAGNINGGNLVVGNYLAGSLISASQPNVTNIGNLIYLTVSNANGTVNFTNTAEVELGNIANLKISGPRTANYVLAAFGNGSAVHWVPQSGGGSGTTISNGTSNVDIATSNGNVTTSVAGNANVLVVTGTGINIAGTLNATGNANVGNLGATGVVATTLGGTLTTAAQPNITSVGTLSSLAVTGNVAAGNLTTTGVLSVTGTGVSSIAGNLDMTSNNIINLASPVNSTDAATKQYVDDVAQGLHTHDTCNAATTGTLATISSGTVTYNNGTSGVGATLTTTGSYTTIDGVTLSNGMRILVKDEANTAHNGIYDRTSSTILTRSSDFDTPTEMAGGDFTFITAGTLYDNTGWVMPDPVTTVGTSPVPWVQFSGAGTYTAGTGLTLTGSQFSVNASQTQVTALGTLTGLNSSGTITAPAFTANTGVFAGSGANLTTLNASNVSSGTLAQARLANSNVILGSTTLSLGTTTTTISGLSSVTSTTFVGALTGAATTAGTVTSAAQGNITSVGTLTGLGVNGTITGVNITANTGVFTGNGSGLSAIAGANVTGTVSSATAATNASALLQNTSTATTVYPTFSTSSANGNSSAVINTGISANLGNASITATTFVGALSGAATSATSATTAGTVTTNAQPNITSVGTLTSLTSSGNITGANVKANAFLIDGVTTGITAAGTVQGNATALTTSINIVTTTNSGTGVILPTAVGGMMISVINAGGNTLAVYPTINGVINSQSANTAYSLVAGGRLQFVAGNTIQWYTLSATYA